LTEGSKCICAASAQSIPYTEQIDSSRCNSACSGNKDEICGGGSEVDWFWLKSPCQKGPALHIRYVFILLHLETIEHAHCQK